MDNLEADIVKSTLAAQLANSMVLSLAFCTLSNSLPTHRISSSAENEGPFQASLGRSELDDQLNDQR